MCSKSKSTEVSAKEAGANRAKEKAEAARALMSFMGEEMNQNRTDNSRNIELPVRHTITMNRSIQEWHKLCAKRTRKT